MFNKIITHDATAFRFNAFLPSTTGSQTLYSSGRTKKTHLVRRS